MVCGDGSLRDPLGPRDTGGIERDCVTTDGDFLGFGEDNELQPPSLTLDDLDAALNRSDILPSGIEPRRLDRGSYCLTIPGFEIGRAHV